MKLIIKGLYHLILIMSLKKTVTTVKVKLKRNLERKRKFKCTNVSVEGASLPIEHLKFM